MKITIDYIDDNTDLINNVIDYYYDNDNDLVIEVGNSIDDIIDLWYVIKFKGNKVRKVTKV